MDIDYLALLRSLYREIGRVPYMNYRELKSFAQNARDTLDILQEGLTASSR